MGGSAQACELVGGLDAVTEDLGTPLPKVVHVKVLLAPVADAVFVSDVLRIFLQQINAAETERARIILEDERNAS